MAWRDDWPCMANGDQYDGKHLMTLVREGKSPFSRLWDVNQLVQEIEKNLDTRVADIPMISKGSNNYGFHLKIFNGPDMLARLARGDVNMPDFDGFPIERQVLEAEFEVAIYRLLRSEVHIRASPLLYYRIPRVVPGPKIGTPQDLSGRRLFVFKRAEGTNNVWNDLKPENKLLLLDQLAIMRAALFSYSPPQHFAAAYLHSRLFEFNPISFTIPVAPTREFWLHVFESKIRATIKNEGDMIGWEDDNETVGPAAANAKQILLRAIPYILPLENSRLPLYRLVLEHGDFGIHNMSITVSSNGEPLVTSLYDWETGCLAPAFLSDPLVAVGPVDLVTDETGDPAATRLPDSSTAEELQIYKSWAHHYIKKLYQEAPEYEIAIRAGKDARYLWFALRDWRGENPEEFFRHLGTWAERRIEDSGVDLPKS